MDFHGCLINLILCCYIGAISESVLLIVAEPSEDNRIENKKTKTADGPPTTTACSNKTQKP